MFSSKNFLVFYFNFYKLNLERGRGRRRESVNRFVVPIFTHSLVNCCMRPDGGSNLQPGVWGRCSHQLSYLPTALVLFCFESFLVLALIFRSLIILS